MIYLASSRVHSGQLEDYLLSIMWYDQQYSYDYAFRPASLLPQISLLMILRTCMKPDSLLTRKILDEPRQRLSDLLGLN